MTSLFRISGLCLAKTLSTILRLLSAFSEAISRLGAHWVLGSWCGNHRLLPPWCVAFSLDSTQNRPGIVGTIRSSVIEWISNGQTTLDHLAVL